MSASHKSNLKKSLKTRAPISQMRSAKKYSLCFMPSVAKAVVGWKKDYSTLLYYYFATLLYTGMRPGREASSLDWLDLHAHQSAKGRTWKIKIHARNSKVRRERNVISDIALYDILNELQAIQCGSTSRTKQFPGWKLDVFRGPVFRNRKGEVPKDFVHPFRRRLIRWGLLYDQDGNERCLYSARHTYITRKLKRKVSLHAISKYVGNSPQIIQRWYDKSIPDDFEDVVVE
jgi:integrase